MTKRAILILAALTLAFSTLTVWGQSADKPAPAAPAAQAQKEEPLPAMGVAPTGKTRFEGTIANTGGTIFLGGWFNVTIEEWTSPEEAAQLKQILAQGGQKALLEKVWKAKQIGSLQVGNSMGKPLFFARAIAVPGGLIVRALTNSPLGRGYGRAGDYPFGFIELVIPNGQKGTGTIVGMAKITLGPDGAPGIEAYGTIPEKIQDVSIVKK